jgi:CxxC motif-containing protein
VRYGWTVTSVHGYGRLKGVTVAPLGDDGLPEFERAEYVRCNTLLVAAGLLPERELLTAGLDGTVLTCGNVNAAHDLVDAVTVDGVRVGIEAAAVAARVAGQSPAETPGDMAAIAALEVAEPLGARLGESVPQTHAGVPPLLDAVCTLCPTSCRLVARGSVEAPVVTGASCERGQAFAREELLDPRRIVSTTVRIEGWSRPLMPVRTRDAVPRSAIAEVMRATRRVRLRAPVTIGSVVIADVAGTGVALIASDDATATATTATATTATETTVTTATSGGGIA